MKIIRPSVPLNDICIRMKHLFSSCLTWVTLIVVWGCAEQKVADNTLFRNVSHATSGLSFENRLRENDTINYFKYPYIYMGGGSAVGDVNGDGLLDIYLTGNMVPNKLYLNKGALQFEDISETAGVSGDNRWFTGVSMIDINADGLLDIYVCVSGLYEPRENLLYINQGIDNGIPTFKESAEQYGLNDSGNSTQATYLDYDGDGDLDVFVANYPPTSFKASPRYYRAMMDNPEYEKSSHLYRNNGDNTFSDVTQETGLLSFGLSLSATAADYNNDGWTDLFVSNDFASPDFFYFNNGDGTFTEHLKETTNQTAFYGMGSDAADFNNDGLIDLVQVDMTPEDNRRSKANMSSMNIPGFWRVVSQGFHFQYMQNMLQVNRGIRPDGLPFFSNVAPLGGVSLTDWSWSPLFADFDNDGWKDLVISNGTRREINHKDYFNELEKVSKEEKDSIGLLNLTEEIPSEEIDNYIFRNRGDLTFERSNDSWGFSFEGFSNGASYADLDNDGDLDVVLNNIDDKVSLFENRASESNGYVRVKLVGPDANPLGVGARVILQVEGGFSQWLEMNPVRGFQSGSDPILHFGIGDEVPQSVDVIWPDGKHSQVSASANSEVVVNYSNAQNKEVPEIETPTLFTEMTASTLADVRHEENPFDDFGVQVLLPHRVSAFGPALATGDINNDGLDDFYLGGAKSHTGQLYSQQTDGSFIRVAGPWSNDALQEDVDALFFDANGDGVEDLYVVSGGNEWYDGDAAYADRLYINTPDGFYKASLPDIHVSGGTISVNDFDGDGDLDVFVGGRIKPHQYPLPTSSYLLENQSNDEEIRFVDVTAEKAPDLVDMGMVASSAWLDVNNDGMSDLILGGEWMAITVMLQENGRFVRATAENNLQETTGWWFSLKVADVDGDGDDDLLAGNLGRNYKYKATPEETFDIYARDYDGNGNIDIVLGYYNNGVQYPVRGKQCSSEQILAIKVKYPKYDDFAIASLEDIYSESDLENSLHYQVGDFSSGWFENMGDGTFTKHPFPNEAQVSIINGFLFDDFDQDGRNDILLAGNLFVSEIETPRADGSVGLLLKGTSDGYTPVEPPKSGFFAPNDVRAIGLIQTTTGKAVLVANNNDQLQLFRVDPKEAEAVLAVN